MTAYTTINDVKDYVHKVLATSEGYPQDFDIEAIASEISTYDAETQGFIITADDGEF
ncbi:hypothetical protein [Corynebacterium durum]|nr:hypothetical protein [Corynebacterium durum]MDO4653410.1 hypothetical protein [Corynebacterium durum]